LPEPVFQISGADVEGMGKCKNKCKNNVKVGYSSVSW
jgi:hypothetical protein